MNIEEAIRTAQDPQRLEALKEYDLLDTGAEEAFDRLTRLASMVTNSPVSLISLIDADRQFFKSLIGLPESVAQARETPLSHSFCKHVVEDRSSLIIEDARQHPILKDNLAIPELNVIAYLGMPLITSMGFCLGSFCVIDTKPRQWNERDIDIIRELALSTMTEIELRAQLKARKQLEKNLRKAKGSLELKIARRTADLEEANRQLNGELNKRLQAESRYRTLFEEAPVMYAITHNLMDPDTITNCNRLFLATLGYLRDEVIDRPISDFCAPDSRFDFHQITEGEGSPFEEVQLLTREGQVIETLFRAIPEFDKNGNASGMRAVFLDITHRKQTEYKFQRLLESIPDAMVIANKEGRIILMNPQTKKLFGYHQNELLDQHLEILLPQRYRDRHMEHMANYFAKPQPRPMGIDLDLWGLHRDGSEFPVEISLSPLEMERDSLYIAIIRDVTTKKQAIEALRESEQTYRALFENANDAIFLISLDGFHIQANQKSADMLGYQLDELVGMNIQNIVDPREIQDVEGRLEDLLTGETIPTYERHFRTKQGDILPVEINVALVKDAGGNPNLIQSIVRDISIRKQSEKSLRESEAKFRSIFESSPVGMQLYQLKPDGRLIFIESNPSANEILNSDLSRFKGLSIEEAFPGITKTGLQDEFRQIIKSGEFLSIDQFVYKSEAFSGIYEVDAFPISPDRMVVAFSDITERILAQQKQDRLLGEIKQQQGQLRTLTRKLSESQEAERKELARELHDQVGQSLTALDFNLNLVQDQLASLEANTEPVMRHIDTSLALLSETAGRIRDVMAELRPPVLDDYGLVAALRWHANRFISPHGIAAQVIGNEPDPRLDRPVEVALFRIAQEALNNVVKHAQAQQVVLRMETDVTQNVVRLIVEDDGLGFSPSERASRTGQGSYGLMTMAERANALGADYRVESHPGSGTSIIVEVAR
jgi:PAS domain S-box-containing protein